MHSPSLLYAMAAHVAWCAVLYVLLTIARAPAVWGLGRRADGSNPWPGMNPGSVRISRINWFANAQARRDDAGAVLVGAG